MTWSIFHSFFYIKILRSLLCINMLCVSPEPHSYFYYFLPPPPPPTPLDIVDLSDIFLIIPKAMAKFNKFQVLMLLVLALLLFITPFLPSSLKPTFLYFIVNLLIISLASEAGFLQAFPRPSSSSEDKKFSASVVSIPEKKEGSSSASVSGSGSASFSELGTKKKPNNYTVLDKFEVKKSDSMPSLLLVREAETMEMEEVVEEEEEGAGINGQELFTKADAFIRNFYKQLKMQRD